MADKADKVKEEVKEEVLDPKEIRTKSFKELAKPPKEEKPKEEEKPLKIVETEKEAEELRKQPDIKEVVKEEVSKAKEELEKKITKIEEDTELSKKEKEEAKEDLRYSWQKENRTPKDYDEIAREAEERALAKAEKLFNDKLKERDDQTTKAKEEALLKEAENKQTEEKAKQEAETQVTSEVNRLVERGLLPKVTDLNEDNEDTRVYKDFFAQAIKHNQEHPEATVRSPIEFYTLHYKPTKVEQPAGADAPIAGNKSVKTSVPSDDKYIYARDHNKPFAVIRQELKKRFG